MHNDLISKRTRNEFREFLVGYTLARITMEFEAANIVCKSEYNPQVSGQRRTLVEQYYRSLDVTNVDDVRKLIGVYEHILISAIRELPNEYDPVQKKREIDSLIECLKQDGYKFQNNKIGSITPETKKVFNSTTIGRSITEITRRNIFDEIERKIVWTGRLDEIDFLKRLFDLESLPSFDDRFNNAQEDIWQHRVNNPEDWSDDWIFNDPRFDLLNCPDERFLLFLCEMVHPVVRPDIEEVVCVVDMLNGYLAEDGWTIVEEQRISGRPVFTYSKINKKPLLTDEDCKNIDNLLNIAMNNLYNNEDNCVLNSDYCYIDPEVRLSRILEISSNRNRFKDVCVAFKNGRLIPLVGSGMSAASGLKTWSDFLRSICHQSTMNKADLENLLSRSCFEEAVEYLSKTMPDKLFDEQIEHELRIDNPNNIKGPISFLPKLFEKDIMTTNLDDLLEVLYATNNCRFDNVLSGTEVGDYRRVKGMAGRVLLKFHGDCRRRNGRVLSKSEYEQAYGDESPVKEELSLIYLTNSLLCLGCSLGPDRTVTLIEEVVKSKRTIPRHYAFLQLPERENVLREREHFLTERGIFPIWYPNDNHDENIMALFLGMHEFNVRE